MKILVIDDDPSVHDLFDRILTREGFRVLSAATGDEGIRLAREHRPQVITLDVMMPSVDGWAILSRLKADPELSDIPVVMLSMIENRSLGFALGAVDYLTKPIDRSEVVSVLKRFRRAGQGEHHVLIVEDDPEARDLFRRTSEREGWTAAEAENGRIGLAQLATRMPDVILLDLMMPEMDGFQFIAELRRNPDWRSIPVIVVTAKSLTEDDRVLLSESVERILQKAEYTPNDLVHEIRHILEAHRAL